MNSSLAATIDSLVRTPAGRFHMWGGGQALITSFLIKQINGFNKHALNSNKSKLYNIYTLKNIYIHIIFKVLQLAIILITLNPFT